MWRVSGSDIVNGQVSDVYLAERMEMVHILFNPFLREWTIQQGEGEGGVAGVCKKMMSVAI